MRIGENDKKEFPIISIIIPHRNIPLLLKRCLDSIPDRNDLQVIVVDDCSDYEPLDVEFLKKTIKIRFELYKIPILKGAGHARNEGLKHAKGKWITFLDADDYFTPLASEIIDDLYKIPKLVDVIFCSANSVDSEYLFTSDRANALNSYIQLYNLCNKDGEMRLRYTFGEPWCKIVKRDLIFSNNIKFTESSIHNDTRYSYLIGYYANTIGVNLKALCTITTRFGSVSRTITEEKKIERIKIFGEEEIFFRDHKIPRKYIIKYLWSQMARSLFENTKTFKQGVDILRNYGINKRIIYFFTIKYVIRNQLIAVLRKLKAFF